jgi:hypothetical protein
MAEVAAEVMHKIEAERYRRLSELAQDAAVKRALQVVADIHSEIADRLGALRGAGKEA